MDYDEIADRYARQDARRKTRTDVARQNRRYFRDKRNRGINE